MNEFIALSIRALNFQRNQLEKHIVEKSGVLLKCIWSIVLEYSYISDNWTKPEYFTNRTVNGYHASGRDIRVVYDTNTSPNIEIVIELDQSTRKQFTSYFTQSTIFRVYDSILGGRPRIPREYANMSDNNVVRHAHVAFINDILIWS